MSTNFESPEMEQILAEADELIQKTNSDALKDLKEEHRLQIEKHAQHLAKVKAEVQERIDKKAASDIGSGATGMHEAFVDIVKAMAQLKRYIS